MSLPPSLAAWLPDSLPWWAQLGVLALAALFAIAFLTMPFALFGLRGRLDLLEAQLDDIQADLRVLTMRLSETQPEHPIATPRLRQPKVGDRP